MLAELAIAVSVAMAVIPPVDLRGANVATVHFVDTQGELNKICDDMVGPRPPNWNWRGCAEVKGQHIFTFNPCNFKDEFYARLMCHELGHINGWAKYHPRGEEYKFPRIFQQTNPKK